MLEVIKKTYRVENEELNELGKVDGIDVGVEFVINGIAVEDTYYGSIDEDESELNIEIISMTIAVDGNSVDVTDCFDTAGLAEEMIEYIDFDGYGNLIYDGDISKLLSSYKKKDLIEG